jgi:hypothetical protein
MTRPLPALAFALLTLSAGALHAGWIVIPNASFESPSSAPYLPYVDAWQQAPSPDAIQTGVFVNSEPGNPYRIDNCDGGRAAFLYAMPQVALFQDYDSTDWSNPAPTHAFDATFEVGKSYTLTVGVLGGTNLYYPMQEGTMLELSLYYRAGGGDKTNVASTVITNSDSIFSNAMHFLDFQVHVPTVQAGDPWAGQHIGVQLLSIVTPEVQGNYWDLDNVRLFSAGTPTLLDPACTNGQFSFTLESEPGLHFEILASTNPALPLSNWISLGTLTNTSGATPFLDATANDHRRFYRARQLP